VSRSHRRGRWEAGRGRTGALSRARTLLVTVAVVVVASAALILFAETQVTTPGPVPTVSGQLRVSSAGNPISPAFYGVGIRGDRRLSSDSASLLTATPIRYLRYPDGDIGERLDAVNGTIYQYGYANTTSAALNLTGFVSLCYAIQCQAIVQLPFEIDSPSTGAYEASYLVNLLHFQPAYWELGNEPADWICFGVPWVDWASGCTGQTTSPDAFANETHAYIAAVRAVDPSARFIGLGGTGNGDADDPTWIVPLEALNGANLSAISVHTYVDDHILEPDLISTENFLSGLSSPYDLPNVLLAARQAVLVACPMCRTQIFATEMDSVSGFNPLATFLPTYYDGLFFAAEETQGLNSQAANIDPFCWENGLITASGPEPRYFVESAFLSALGPVQYNASVNVSAAYAAATGGGGDIEVLVANANASSNLNLSLKGSGVDLTGPVSVRTWNPTQATPSVSSESASELTTILLPPASLELLIGPGSFVGTPFSSSPPAGSGPS
jgi:hypothetical protein